MYNMIIYDYILKKGGPSGYLHNLKGCSDLNLISRGFERPENTAKKRTKRFQSIRRFLQDLRKPFRQDRRRKQFFLHHKEAINSARVNHFHSTSNFYYCDQILKNDAIKVLTTHSPQPFFTELQEALEAEGLSKSIVKRRVAQQKRMDIYSLERSDYIVFPCPEALGPYETFFDEINFDRSKIRYVLTGVEPLGYRYDREGFCALHGIDPSKKIVAYIGRKNRIKGFDRFIELARTLEGRDDVVFVCAGLGMETPALRNIIDLGWTDDPGSIISAADVVVVPNRDTYFDINIIQVLSIGTPMITTPTGGNRWFEKFSDLHMFFFRTEEELKDVLERTLEKSLSKEVNRKVYHDYFTTDLFCKNYVTLFDSLDAGRQW